LQAQCLQLANACNWPVFFYASHFFDIYEELESANFGVSSPSKEEPGTQQPPVTRAAAA
jgi:hypothetical protein